MYFKILTVIIIIFTTEVIRVTVVIVDITQGIVVVVIAIQCLEFVR